MSIVVEIHNYSNREVVTERGETDGFGRRTVIVRVGPAKLPEPETWVRRSLLKEPGET